MKTTLKNIRRSPYQALAAIVVTSLTLFVIAIFAVVSFASESILNDFETKPQIIAYLKDDHTREQANQLINILSGEPVIKSVQYISKDQALEIYKQSVNNDPLLLGTVTDLGLVTADILPASIEISVESPKDFDQAASLLNESSIISVTPQGQKEIDFPRDVVEELTKWTRAIRTAGILLITVLSLTSVLTIMIIISLKVSSRRPEIGTLKLIGAQNKFILRPYLLEGLIYGGVSAFISWIMTYIAVLYSTPFLAPRLSGIIALPIPFLSMAILFVALVFFSAILVSISSFWAVARFLKR